MNRSRACPVPLVGILAGSVLASSHSLAHHALLAFDNSRLIEVRGVIEDVFWANPHIRITVRTADDTVWDLEGSSLNSIERNSGLTREDFPIGEEAAFTGIPSRRGDPRMRPALARLSSGQVVVIERSRVEQLGLLDDIADRPAADSEQVEEAVRTANGIFRVWTNIGRTRDHYSDADLPLTDAARMAKESWNQEEDDTLLLCIPAGMPEAMLTPFPMEFTDAGDSIVLHLEEWDNVRTIHMRGDAGRANQATSHLGYSVGRWEDGALVVSTTEIDHPFMDDLGTPLSRSAEIIERFEMSEGETRLDWSATIIDPETFTAPVVLPIVHFEWQPGTQIKPYNCTVFPG